MVQGYEQQQYVPQQPPMPQHAPPPQPRLNDRDALPSRQRTQSLESPTSSMYSQQQQEPAYSAGPPQQQQHFGNVSQQHLPEESPTLVPQQQYQAYQPGAGMGAVQQRQVSGGGVGDPGDYYR